MIAGKNGEKKMLLAEVPKTQVKTKSEHTNQLLALEAAAIREGKTCSTEGWTEHYHCNGAYARKFTLPDRHWVTGQIHRFACINIVAKGRVLVKQSDGEYILEAGEVYISEPGEKKILLALEETVFINIHATEETDQEKLWEHFVVPPENALEHQVQLRLEDK